MIIMINIATTKYFLLARGARQGDTISAFLFILDLEILTVCYYHVTYAFQSESALYSCLNVKELLARNRHDI